MWGPLNWQCSRTTIQLVRQKLGSQLARPARKNRKQDSRSIDIDVGHRKSVPAFHTAGLPIHDVGKMRQPVKLDTFCHDSETHIFFLANDKICQVSWAGTFKAIARKKLLKLRTGEPAVVPPCKIIPTSIVDVIMGLTVCT